MDSIIVYIKVIERRLETDHWINMWWEITLIIKWPRILHIALNGKTSQKLQKLVLKINKTDLSSHGCGASVTRIEMITSFIINLNRKLCSSSLMKTKISFIKDPISKNWFYIWKSMRKYSDISIKWNKVILTNWLSLLRNY